jgi:hypothetical protein
MPKHYPSELAVPSQEPQGDWPLLLACDDFDERFYALLDDHDLEEVFREFLVPVRRGG